MSKFRRLLPIALLAVTAATIPAQPPTRVAVPNAPSSSAVPVPISEQDAQRTREELGKILDRYAPTVRSVFSLDPTLLNNQAYMTPYPALANFLTVHPEVVRNPTFYFGSFDRRFEHGPTAADMWRDAFQGLAIFGGFGMAIGLLTWLIRTFIDYRRWSRLSKVQSDVHTKLLDRFTGNDELAAYIQSPAGSKFLQSAPITLDVSNRSLGAPLGRILWSLQIGVVLVAGGIGFQIIAGRASLEAAQPIGGLGILSVALGLGFVISAIISFMISNKLGLIEPGSPPQQDGPVPARNQG